MTAVLMADAELARTSDCVAPALTAGRAVHMNRSGEMSLPAAHSRDRLITFTPAHGHRTARVGEPVAQLLRPLAAHIVARLNEAARRCWSFGGEPPSNSSASSAASRCSTATTLLRALDVTAAT